MAEDSGFELEAAAREARPGRRGRARSFGVKRRRDWGGADLDWYWEHGVALSSMVRWVAALGFGHGL
ncbi:hypothetical protein M0R45_018499 [Rubus argutus]|uniref:Uncharacterized protein n=1 Tax=Rubus argutus TaxID=59490 RepID=A0AAW1X3L7_RUBAR